MAKMLNKNILCPSLKNISFKVNTKPVRITVNAIEKRCFNHINVVNTVINAINAPVELEFKQFIGRYEMGEWTGAIGQVVYNKSDVAIGTFTATYDRSRWTRLSSPLGYSNPVAILSGRLSQHSIENEFQVFKTYSPAVWLGLFMSVLAVGIVNYFGKRRSFHLDKLFLNIINSYKSALAQSVSQFKYVGLSKYCIMIATSLLSFSILIYWFKTLILSNLLCDSDVIIDSIEDLVNFLKSKNDQTNITIASIETKLTWYLLKYSDDENFKYIYSLLKNKYDVKDIYNGKCIAICYGNTFDYLINGNEHLDLHVSRQQYFGSAVVILYSKTIDKTLKERIDCVIRILFESGLQNFWRYSNSYKRLNFDQIQNDQTISVQRIKGIMSLLAVVYTALILIFIFETYWHKLSLAFWSTVRRIRSTYASISSKWLLLRSIILKSILMLLSSIHRLVDDKCNKAIDRWAHSSKRGVIN